MEESIPLLSLELENQENSSDWMSRLDRLCDASVGDIIWPGTHDSGAHCENFDYSKLVSHDRLRKYGTFILNRIGDAPRRFVDKWTRTQKLSIYEQLMHGTRFLDLRVSKCPDDGRYYIVHSFCGPPLEDVLREIVSFMELNIQECLLIEVVPCSFVDHSELCGQIEQSLGHLMLRRDLYRTTGLSPFLLKFSDLLENGRIVVFYKVSHDMDRPPAFWDSKSLYAPFTMSMEPEEKESFQLEYFDSFIKAKKNAADSSAESSSQDMFHFMYALTPRLSEIVCSLFPSPYRDRSNPYSLEDCARKINPRLLSFFEKIKYSSSGSSDRESGGMIITIDFIEQSKLVQLAIQANNKRLRSS